MRLSSLVQLMIAHLWGVVLANLQPQAPLRLQRLQQYDWPMDYNATDHSKLNSSAPGVLAVDTVKQYTGYIDIGDLDKHLFYWMFESRNDPVTDPVVLWLSGDPGSSSFNSMFFELGPSSLNSSLHPVRNPYSWNSNSTIIFLDLPVGVGYSYSDSERVTSSRSAAKDVYEFLEQFFVRFPHFAANEFHIAGESYGGHYVPAVATEILNHTNRSFQLSSIMIGNGLVNPLVQYGTLVPLACGSVSSLLEPHVCEEIAKTHPACAVLQDVCYNTPNSWSCYEAEKYCHHYVLQPCLDAGLNFFDIRKEAGQQELIEVGLLEQYLSSDQVRVLLGAKVNFTSFNPDVKSDFAETGDGAKGFLEDLVQLLDSNVPVLMYAGDKDFIYNWVGVLELANSLKHRLSRRFQRADLQPWHTTEGTLAGEVKNYGNFTFVKIYDAGHQAPRDQPKICLDMLNSWLQGNYSLGYRR